MRPLDALIEAFLAAELAHSPVLASSLGLTAHDDRLDDLSAEAFAWRADDAAAYRERFAAVPDGALGAEERIDRDLAVAMLDGRRIQAEWAGWKRDPLVYSGTIVSGVYGLFLHRLRPEAELVAAACARLAEARRALEQGRANLEAALADPLIVERAIGSARGGARYVRDLLPSEAADPHLREQLRAAGADAGAALDDWAEWLGELAGSAHGSWVFGEERYTRILREREQLPWDARGLRDVGRREFERLDAEMRMLALRIAGTEDWHEVIDRANREDHPRTEAAMREAYEVWTARARDFLVREGIVTLPEGEECTVEPSPVFQRPVIGVASYIAPPAFSDSLTGHFFVPFAPDGASPEEVDERLASNSHGGIPTTSVHEAYPGHHWHLVMRRLHAAPLRRVLSTPYFNEGWALYAEQVMRERGFFQEPIQELYHLEATIFRAARIVIDTSMHLGEMTIEEGVAFLRDRLAMPEPTARAEIGRYAWWPTQASSYLTGCLEILRTRRDWLAAHGHGETPIADLDPAVLRSFHDTLAMSGSLPPGLARRAMLGG